MVTVTIHKLTRNELDTSCAVCGRTLASTVDTTAGDLQFCSPECEEFYASEGDLEVLDS
jgi:hypothetical protein